jgi:cytochrome c biogenesis protein CcmG/thiol:disulfide interchange protein DsbE
VIGVDDSTRGSQTSADAGQPSTIDPPDPARLRPRKARRGPVALAIAAAGLFIGLLIFGVLAQAPNTAIDDSLAQGHAAPAPGFDLEVLQRGEPGAAFDRRLAPALADGRLSTAELRGIPVVLNIWASWCDPCRQEAALLERAWRTQGRPAGTLFLGLDQQDTTGDARAFMRQYAVDYLNVHDLGNDVPRSYGATGIPETYFISARGEVVGHVSGAISPRELRDGIIAARSGQLLGVRSGGARRPSR